MPCLRGLHRLRHARAAATALEFALVAPLFLLLTLVIMEDGLMLFCQSLLDNATRDAARQVKIGTVTTSTQFQTAVCNDVSAVLDCNKLNSYVLGGLAFPSSITMPAASGSGPTMTFTTSLTASFVVVEVTYSSSLISPWLSSIMASNWVLTSVQAFQNEPYYGSTS